MFHAYWRPERLIITHGDHVGAYDEVVDRFDVETWMSRKTEADVDTEPDHRYADGDRIGQFEVVNVPGHEDDSNVLVDEDAGFAIIGDVVGADIRGLPAGYFVIHDEE